MGLFKRNRNDEDPRTEEAKKKSDEDKRLVEERMAKTKARLRRLLTEVQTYRRDPE